MQKVIDFVTLAERLRQTSLYQNLVRSARKMAQEDKMNLEDAITRAVKDRKGTLNLLIADKHKPDSGEDDIEDKNE